MYEYDARSRWCHLHDAARIYRSAIRSRACAWRCAIRWRRRAWCANLALQLGGGFYVSDWTRNHANFFRSIQVTKSMMFVILLLVVAVAAFNIVATLVMVVKDKRPAISPSCARSVPLPRNVLAIFSMQGSLDRTGRHRGRRAARAG